MRGIIHPFTKALYEQDGTGNIRVTHRSRVGIFGSDGHWISGELRECDPQMCGWVAGPQIASLRIAVEHA
ncbi:MAG: transposase [Actinomycetota bacterium]|nr:transposase [Actinomycetota bacterium]